MKRSVLLIGFILTTFVAVFGQTSSEIVVQGNSLTRKFEWLLSNAETGNAYVIILDRNENISIGQNLDYDGRDVTIIIRGRGSMRNINFNVTASQASESSDELSLFSIRSGVTLILDNLVALTFQRGNYWGSLVRIGNGGKFIINEGTAVMCNDYFGTVWVGGGIFIMNGGTITGNQGGAVVGGGLNTIYVRDGGSFIMNGGTISSHAGHEAGAICIFEGSSFTMNNGTISSNTSLGSGGVNVLNGYFIMTGGTISGNSSVRDNNASKGGVNIADGGIFTMTGGTIASNSGGVYIENGGTFNLNSPATKSSIIGNRISQVFVDYGGFFRVNGLLERSY